MSLCRLFKSDAPPEDLFVDVTDGQNIAAAIGLDEKTPPPRIECKTLARFVYAREGGGGGCSEVRVDLYMDDSARPGTRQNLTNPIYRGSLLLVVSARHVGPDGDVSFMCGDYTDVYPALAADDMVRNACHLYLSHPKSAEEDAAARRLAERVEDMHAL